MTTVNWRRNGLPTCSRKMLDVLKTLETARVRGDEFIHLLAWKKTLKALANAGLTIVREQRQGGAA